MNLNEFQWSSFQMPFSIFWLCNTVCLFTFHFTVMLIANPFPSVSVSRRTSFFSKAYNAHQGGLKQAWIMPEAVLHMLIKKERERDPSRLTFSHLFMLLCYGMLHGMLRHFWKHPNVFGGIVRTLDEHMFRTGRSRPYHEIRELAPS